MNHNGFNTGRLIHPFQGHDATMITPLQPSTEHIKKRRPPFLKNFLIPDWTADNLPSQDFIDLVKSMRLLLNEAKDQYKEITANPTPTFKTLLHKEFIDYAASNNIDTHEIAQSGYLLAAHKRITIHL